MTTPEAVPQLDLHFVRNFFDAGTCRELIAELRSSPAHLAVVYGIGNSELMNEHVRKVTRKTTSRASAGYVKQRLMNYRAEIEQHFGISLGNCEEPQFLCYGVGDFFVAHQDGNTGMLQLGTDQSRRVSITIFLNDQTRKPGANSYCGGSLVFSDYRQGTERWTAGEAGTLIAFRSEITHEVKPVTHGERFSIVSWYQSQAP